MEHDTESKSPEFPPAQRILAGIAEQAPAGRCIGDGGADWERLRSHAFRHFVLRPMARGGRVCLQALARLALRSRSAAVVPRAREAG